MFGFIYILVLPLVINSLQKISPFDTVGFKAIIKCREYQRKSFQYTISSDPDAIVFPIEIPSTSSFQEKNTTGALPFSVLLYNDENQPLCHGVLISEYFVLSTIHCNLMTAIEGARSTVIESASIGRIFVSPSERIQVSRTILHPKYILNSSYHDILLVELKKRVLISPEVRPACLQTSNTIADHEWFINTWVRGPNNTLTLKTKAVTEYQSDECQKWFEDHTRTPYGVIGHLQICTRRGDFQNAIFLRNKGIPGYTIIGIPTVVIHPPKLVPPQVYTRISKYIGWIESHVWPNEPRTGCNKFLFSH